MTMNDPLAAALSKIENAERIGRKTCTIKPVSKVIKTILSMMMDYHYIGEYKEVEDGRGNFIELQLLGKINKCGAIKPRSPVKKEDIEKFEKRYLPAKDFGVIILSTQKGMMSNHETKKQGLGGKLVAYCY
ncbi:30S ribosomal protein S8 [Candidatus Woesearchaeota archaeon]|nr:30S ribosomal protein S8 [Candidatus Woesearchaeota archaeon]